MLFNIELFKLAAILSALIRPTLFHKGEWIGETVDWPQKNPDYQLGWAILAERRQLGTHKCKFWFYMSSASIIVDF